MGNIKDNRVHGIGGSNGPMERFEPMGIGKTIFRVFSKWTNQ
jgi:hypothetical protein